jgi:alkanesulfonate monooxygenase SsuD/methylene tetrahydromethanopterin reductase-like flavin-dependent oxidoreductase (luciferase family)
LGRTREYVEIIRLALSGGPVDYQGRFFQLRRFRLGLSPVQQHLPIYLASLGPKNLELTGQLADGWLPIWVDNRRLPNLKETVAKAASRAGRDISEITVAPQILCYTAATEEELAEAAAQVRGHMAYYIGGMGSYYYNLFCRFGYRSEADKVREAWTDRRRDQAAAAITDEMLENITVLGDADTCRAKLEQFRSQGADMPVVAFPHGASPAAVRRTLEALAPRAANAPLKVEP